MHSYIHNHTNTQAFTPLVTQAPKRGANTLHAQTVYIEEYSQEVCHQRFVQLFWSIQAYNIFNAITKIVFCHYLFHLIKLLFAFRSGDVHVVEVPVAARGLCAVPGIRFVASTCS